MKIEKRQHPRYAIELDAEITVAETSVSGRTQDISRGGFCMLAQGSVPIGAAGEVKLALVFSETEFSEHLVLPAMAVWCTPMKGAYQIGVKFAPLDPQNRGYLDLFIKFLDGDDDVDDDDEGPTE
ncbi:MAG TPA: PilZ domain-containing protein [Polyangia bacterium]